MSDFYTYRNEVAGKKRKRSLMLALLIVLAAACAGVGWFWMQRDAQPAEGEAAAAEPVSTSESTEAESEAPVEAAAPAEPVSTGDGPARIVQAVDTAVWDTSTAVERTIDTEYLNTDHRMVAVPMLGTVTSSYFDTVTFAGDSIASGLGIYDTGYKNAHYATYVSAGVQTFVNNVSVKNAVTGATETPMETIVASQPDYLYILVGTNNLVVQGSEESFIAYYERLIDNAVAVAMQGEISDFTSYVDPAQNVLSTRRMTVSCRIRPRGMLRDIIVNLGFENPAIKQ